MRLDQLSKAAPDLYAALESLIWLVELKTDWLKTPIDSKEQKTLRRAKAAIMLARRVRRPAS